MKLKLNEIIQGDALDVLKRLPDESIDMAMTSPPYWGLRDYGTASWEGGDKDCDHRIDRATRTLTDKSKIDSSKTLEDKGSVSGEYVPTGNACPKCGAIRIDLQLGLESTFQEYINKLCDIFDEVKRVLKKEGTCWVNLGDTYNNSSWQKKDYKDKFDKKQYNLNKMEHGRGGQKGYPDKCLTQIPSRFAIEMTNRGWILRNEIIWHKPNCMPSSVEDRFTVDFEKLFFFTKSKKYYFEQQREPSVDPESYTGKRPRNAGSMAKTDLKNYQKAGSIQEDGTLKGTGKTYPERNKRCVWKINPKPYADAHFAVYPQKLCEIPIKAGCPEFICKKCGKAREKITENEVTFHSGSGKSGNAPEGKWENGQQQTSGKYDIRMGPKVKKIDKGYTGCGCSVGWKSGVVLDPFFGSGTTGYVAQQLDRNWIGIELSEEYIKLAENRFKQPKLI